MSTYVCPYCGAEDSTRCDKAAEMRLADRDPRPRELAQMRAVGCRVAHYIDIRS